MPQLLIDQISSPIGDIFLVTKNQELCALDFSDSETRLLHLLQKRFGQVKLSSVSNPEGFSQKLLAYFEGNYSILDKIPVNLGGTAFQQLVWTTLQTIQPGATISYGELATKIGKPNAARAVGLANSLNPIAIVIPCHRVVGTKTLTGYAGGLERKRWLLSHEGVNLTNFSESSSFNKNSLQTEHLQLNLAMNL